MSFVEEILNVVDMDYLARKREYSFKNINNEICRIHTHLVYKGKFEIWRENDDKRSRRITDLIIRSCKGEDFFVPKLVVVNSKYLKVIAAYDHEKDIIYLNKDFYSLEVVKQHLKSNYFVADNFKGVLLHEYGHKLHWDAIKNFYKQNKKKYNNIKEAKMFLDSRLESYLNRQYPGYIRKEISSYAEDAFLQSHSINEVIAEYIAKGNINDKSISFYIKEILNYANIK